LRKTAAALTIITMPDHDIPSGTPEVLDRLASAAMARISELVREIPDGTEEERGALATAVMSEILARTLAIPDAAFVAEIANAVLAAHNLVWRLVALS
jgi:hypothetical protein